MQDSDLRELVELRGFEPLTPSMRTRCATGLRYSPKNGCQRSKYRRLFAHLAVVRRPAGEGSVADGTFCGVGVLVVDLVADAGGDVDDLGIRWGFGICRHGHGGRRPGGLLVGARGH